MRTLSAKHPKGQEPPRRLLDEARLLLRIVRMLLDYWLRGRRIRRLFYARQRSGRKLYVEEAARWRSS